MSVSQWCAFDEAMPISIGYEDGWRDEVTSGHEWCASERWHDDYHGRDPGCCASPEERESWACTCSCHEGAP